VLQIVEKREFRFAFVFCFLGGAVVYRCYSLLFSGKPLEFAENRVSYQGIASAMPEAL
jgi:hypothetical protein